MAQASFSYDPAESRKYDYIFRTLLGLIGGAICGAMAGVVFLIAKGGGWHEWIKGFSDKQLVGIAMGGSATAASWQVLVTIIVALIGAAFGAILGLIIGLLSAASIRRYD